jgi:hypothetical protein
MWPPFNSIRGSIDTLVAEVDRFAGMDDDPDTDYGAALATAADVWPTAPADTCRLMVWFTDGELDFDYRGSRKTIGWMDPPFELGSTADADRAKARAVTEICAVDGVADRFRTAIGPEAGDGAFVIGVTLGASTDYSLLRKIILNENGDCGAQRTVGDVLQSAAVDDLVEQLIIASDPSRQRSAIGPFEVSEAVETLRLRISWPDTVEAPELRAPDGEQRSLVLASSGTTLGNGATLDVVPEGASQSVVTIRTPATIGTWDGTWDVVTPSGAAVVGQMYLQDVTGELRLELAKDDLVLRRGMASAASAQLVSRSGELRSAGAWARSPASELTISWDTGSAQLVDQVKQDGTVPFTVALDRDDTRTELTISASIRSFTEVFPGQPIELTPWEGELGRLAVKDIPKSPIVDPIEYFDAPLNQDKASAETKIPVRTEGEGSRGCLTLTALGPTGPSAGEVTVEIFDGDTKLEVGEVCSANFDDNEQRKLTLRITAPPELVRKPGIISGNFRFESRSEINPDQIEPFAQSFTVQVDPEYIVVRPSASTWLLWLALSLLLPLVLLYGYNALVAAKVDVVPGLYARLPVTIGSDRITRHGDDTRGSLTIASLAEHEITPLFDTGLHQGAIDVGPARFQARISAWPWGEPHGEVTVEGAALVVSTDGTTPTGRAGRTGLTTARAWVFWSDEAAEQPQSPTVEPGSDAEPATAGPASTTEPVERHGTLLVMLPPTPYGGDITGLATEFDDALAHAHRTVSAVYATGTRPSRWTSFRRRFARPDRPVAERPNESVEPTADRGDLRTPDDDAFAGPSPF